MSYIAGTAQPYNINKPKLRGGEVVTRIYKNASGETIALDEIGIDFYSVTPTNQSPSHDVSVVMTAGVKLLNRTKLILGTASSRVIASIEMIGSFDSITENSGNYYNMTWTWDDGGSCEVNIESFAAAITDSI